jgi:hypothetical protein
LASRSLVHGDGAELHVVGGNEGEGRVHKGGVGRLSGVPQAARVFAVEDARRGYVVRRDLRAEIRLVGCANVTQTDLGFGYNSLWWG